MSKRGRLLVFSSPSGGGKNTIINALRKRHPDWGYSVSVTTRQPRSGEVNGEIYHFVSREEFEKKIEAGDFLEYEEVHGYLYGTLKSETMRRLDSGETLCFDLDVKGALHIKKLIPEALLIFLKPPSKEVLLERLRGRLTDSPEEMSRRLERMDMELSLAPQFDICVVNDELERVVGELDKRMGFAQ
ncbi:guanylate kinase [bacterium]|nr:guanylate kinase [bacterium]